MKSKLKMLVDVVMTALFLVEMAYHVTGNSLHEWLGMGLFALFLLHHGLNWNWHRTLFHGKYTPARVFMTVLDILLLLSMLGMMVSGILLSRDVLRALHLRAGMFGRRLHMISTAWGFVLMAAHVGFHWGQVIAMCRKKVGQKAQTAMPRVIAVLLALYGVYAFWVRHLGEYMFLRREYAFFDYEEPAVLFFADYIAIMALFACLSYYLMKGLVKVSGRKRLKSAGKQTLLEIKKGITP